MTDVGKLTELCEKVSKCEAPTVLGSLCECILQGIAQLKDADLTEYQKLHMKKVLVECVKDTLCRALNNLKTACPPNEAVTPAVLLPILDLVLCTLRIHNAMIDELMILCVPEKGRK